MHTVDKFKISSFNYLKKDGTKLCNDLKAPPAKLAKVEGLMFELYRLL